jgi:hypothetical protein
MVPVKHRRICISPMRLTISKTIIMYGPIFWKFVSTCTKYETRFTQLLVRQSLWQFRVASMARLFPVSMDVSALHDLWQLTAYKHQQSLDNRVVESQMYTHVKLQPCIMATFNTGAIGTMHRDPCSDGPCLLGRSLRVDESDNGNQPGPYDKFLHRHLRNLKAALLGILV